MAEQFPRPTNAGRPPRPIRWRRLAVMIMVAGAAGFALTLVFYNENLLCLSGSTLVTLAGLGLLVNARRRGWEPAETFDPGTPSEQSAWRRPRFGSRVPPGLRAYRPAQAPFIEPKPVGPLPQPALVGPVENRLADQVRAIFAGQGAQVTVETLRADRSVLRVAAAGGLTHIALVLESPSPAEAAEGRALLALLNQPGASQNGLGYLIAAGGFSPSAYQWADGRGQIRLVSADELDELGI